MALTTKQKADLDGMNVAVQRADGISGAVSLRKIEQTVAFGEFTGASAVGTFELTDVIPAGASFLVGGLTAIVGFAGDTSAALSVGDGTDVDRYNTGTLDVFTTVAAGVGFGVPAGLVYHIAESTVKITITTTAAWSSVTAGSISVVMYYLD